MMKRLSAGLLGSLLIASPLMGAEQLPAPIQALESQGVKVLGSFDAPGGLKGYAVRYRGDVLEVYLTPDKQHTIVGTLLSEAGVPAAQRQLEELVDQSFAQLDWNALSQSSWIGEGDKDAKQIVYAFMDPNCPYCAMFWQKAQPYLKQKGIQLRHIMVGVISPTSLPIAAKMLAAPDPDKLLAEHMQKKAQRQEGLSAAGNVPDDAVRKVNANSKLMGDNDISGTPAIVYKDKQGKTHVIQGLPSDEVMEQIFSTKP